MKKLLVLGNNYHTNVLVKFAQEREVYVIVADNLPESQSPVKKMANEAWDISVTDIDILEEKAREEGVTAVTCGASELCMRSVRELCKRLDLPFYVSDKTWEIINDKLTFKEYCEKLGISTPVNFEVDENFKPEDLGRISYPVMVKPADGCSSIGLHKCHSDEELIAAYKDALDKSAKKRVVVEEYLDGEEVALLFAFKNGKAYLVESSSVVGYKEMGIPFLFGGSPSWSINKIRESLLPKLDDLFAELGCMEGVGCIQLIMNEGEPKVLEMNYRLPGGQASPETQIFLVNTALDCVLNENVVENMPYPEPPVSFGCVVWLKPGTITEIKGMDKIQSEFKLNNFYPMKKVGDTVIENTGMRQMYAILNLNSDQSDYKTFTRFVHDNLFILDENGNDMVRRFEFDPETTVVTFIK